MLMVQSTVQATKSKVKSTAKLDQPVAQFQRFRLILGRN